MTTEEKLSALKAINEEKENIDDAIESFINKDYSGFMICDVPIPSEIKIDSDNIIKEYFFTRRQELITQAELLIKS